MALQLSKSEWDETMSKYNSVEYQKILQKNDQIISLRRQLKSSEIQQAKLQFQNDWLLNICIGLILICTYLVYYKIKNKKSNT